jgi:putative membrane protein
VSPPAELEGRLHPLGLVVVARRFVGASLIPALALFLSAGTRVVVPAVLLALLVGLPLALLSWWRFRYRVSGGRLELHSGVLSRSVRTIPLERVRGIHVTEPFLHRLLGLVRVDVEAAAGGGQSAELSLPAVTRRQADELREALLAASPGPEFAEPPVLYRATPGRLAAAGVTSLSYLFAPAAIVGVALNLADDLPGGYVERAVEAAADRFPTDAMGLALIGLGAAALVLFSAAVGSLLVDWDFTLRDEGERLTAARGLLTRRVVHLDRDRIRGADVRDTPLRRPVGLAAVTAIAAGVGGREGGTTLAPVLRREELPALLSAVDEHAPSPHAPLASHPTSARSRRLVRAAAVPLVLLALFAALGAVWAAAAALVALAAAVPLGLDRYRQLWHAFDGRRLALREGSLRRRWSELDPDAAVSFELRSSPGQRRAGVATLTVHLGQGAGSRRALDIGEEQAAELLRRVRPQLFERRPSAGGIDKSESDCNSLGAPQ